MGWLALILSSLAIAGITLWLNAKLNERERALQEQVKNLEQRESYFKQERTRHEANLDERLKKAQAQDQSLKERKTELDEFAQWLKEQDLRMQKIYDGMEAKVKTAYTERDQARQRAKRLQEELKQLKAKTELE